MAQTSTLQDYDDETLVEMYRRMRLIRSTTQAMETLADQEGISATATPYTGQEAVAVGTCLPLLDGDLISTNHRSHGHALARGIDLNKVMAEWAGKEAGVSYGRGGEMHMFDAEHGLLESTGIMGAGVPHVAGAMLSGHSDGDNRVGVAFFGDGTANQGVIYETMNLASIWNLPVLFLCENNQYAGTTPREYAVAGERISDRAEGFDIPGKTIDGQDVITVYNAVSDAIHRARTGDGPQFIECETYRIGVHISRSKEVLKDRPYRQDEEIEKWRDRDPITIFTDQIIENGITTQNELSEIDAEIATLVDDAVEYMKNANDPSAERAFANVYASQDYQNLPAPRYR